MKGGKLVIAIAATVAAIAGGATNATATPQGGAAVDLSTPASIAAYLTSKGVDLATVVWQTGPLNYAGPRCPGALWNCTTAANVVQISQAGGQNKFECDPAFFENGEPPFPIPEETVTDPELGVCVIVQINESGEGQNHARCFEHTTANPAALNCYVYQENVEGDNFLQVHQRVRQTMGADQDALVNVDVVQENTAGNNHAHLLQQVNQSTADLADLNPTDPGLEQAQRATFDIDPFEQRNEAGNNGLHMTQHLHQDGSARGDTTTRQEQFSTQFGDVDQFASVGEELSVTQVDEQGFSQTFAHQSEHQQLTGPGTLFQFGPQGCCGAGTQTGDPQQTHMNILEESVQAANGGIFEQQSQTINGSCNSTGICDITHHARNDADSSTASNRGTGVTYLNTSCFAVTAEGESGGDCETDTEPPPS